MPATCWPGSAARSLARPATSPAVCRVSPSCSRRASPKDPSIIAECSTAAIEYGKDYKAKRRLLIVPLEDDALDPVEHT